MSQSEANYIFGPREEFRINCESIGKYVFDLLKKREPQSIINIDSVTKEVLTCGQLLEDSIKIACSFKHNSIKKGDIVSIISENTIHYVSIILAGFYVGVTINPLNPQYSTRELQHAFLAIKPKMVFCSRNCLKEILNVKDEFQFIKTIILMERESFGDDGVKTLKQFIENVMIDVNCFEPENSKFSNHNALICLSSGTTGLPKGVINTHENFKVAIDHWTHPNHGNCFRNETTIVVVPLFHIFGLILQFIGIVSNTKLIITNKFDPHSYLELIQNYKIKQLYIVPPLLLFLSETPLLNTYDLSSIKDILCGAAPVGKELHDKTLKRFGNVTIRQLYGLTEVCGTCTFQKPGSNLPGNVGTLLPNYSAKVVIPYTNQAVGPFKVGELCFKGPTEFKGYLGNVVATQDMFDEEGFCHTGDTGFYDKNGAFYVIDRIKDLIKYKGFQVPPAELEDLILTHPDVNDCGVIGIVNERTGQVPLAYVVLKNGSVVSEQDIVDFVAERISVQKHLHGGVRFINKIPKNPSGKILRRQLKELYKST